MNAVAMLDTVKRVGASGLGAPIILMMILGMVVLPLPPIALDVFSPDSV